MHVQIFDVTFFAEKTLDLNKSIYDETQQWFTL